MKFNYSRIFVCGTRAVYGRAVQKIEVPLPQTGHRSAAMGRRYIRDGALFRDNAAAQLGL